MATNEKLDDIYDPIYTDNNPFKKLMEGFCRPNKIMNNNNGDDDDNDNDRDDGYHDDGDHGEHYVADKYAPDLTPASNAKQHQPHQHSIDNNDEEVKGEPAASELLDNDGTSTTIPKKTGNKQLDSASNSGGSSGVNLKIKPDDYTPGDTIMNAGTSRSFSVTSSSGSIGMDAGTDTTTETIKKQLHDTSSPEMEVSKRVTMMRRKRGIENIIMSCIFVLTTLLTLKKLGFTTSDFDFVLNDASSSSSSWIQIFDKQKEAVVSSSSTNKEVIDETEEEVEEEESDDVNEETAGGTEDDDGNYYNPITSSKTENEL